MPSPEEVENNAVSAERLERESVHPDAFEPDASPTPASQWSSKRKEGFVVRLPSGNTCRMRRTMDLMTLLRTGQIPNPLNKVVAELIREGTKGKTPQGFKEGLNEEQLEQMMDLIDKTCVKSILEPTVKVPPEDPDEAARIGWVVSGREEDPSLWGPPDGNISIHDLTMEDKMFVFNVAQGMAASLNRFREEQDSAMARLSGGEPVPAASQPAGGN